MSKKLKSIFVLTAIATSILVQPIGVNAAETKINIVDTVIQNQDNSKEVLTLEEAINSAIKNSDTIELCDKKISYQEKIDSTNRKLEHATDIDDDLEDYNKDSRELNIKTLKQDKEFEEDKLKQKVTDEYNSLISSQIEISNLEMQIEIQNSKLENTKLKTKLDLAIPLDAQESDINVQKLTNKLNSLKSTLSNSEDSFKTLTGKDVGKYRLDTNIQYDTFEIDGDVDEYIDGVIDKYLKYNKKSINLTKDYLEDNKVDDPGKFDEDKPKKSDYKDDEVKVTTESSTQSSSKDTTSSTTDNKVEGNTAASTGGSETKNQNTTTKVVKTAQQKYDAAMAEYENHLREYTQDVNDRIQYLKSKIGNYEAEVSLSEQKKNLKDALKKYYTLLNSKEYELNVLKQQIDVSNQKRNIGKQKLDLGLIIKSDYDNMCLDVNNLSLELRKAVYDYNTTKEKIQKPWLELK